MGLYDAFEFEVVARVSILWQTIASRNGGFHLICLFTICKDQFQNEKTLGGDTVNLTFLNAAIEEPDATMEGKLLF